MKTYKVHEVNLDRFVIGVELDVSFERREQVTQPLKDRKSVV